MPLPLLRLPEKLTVDVLRTFGIQELLAISLLSKRAKNAVQLLKLRKLHGNLRIGNSIKFEICSDKDIAPTVFLEFYNNSKKQNIVLDILKNVTVTSDGNQMVEWKFPLSKMTMNDWYFHIAEIFCPYISIYFEIEFAVFNFESIKKTFTNIDLYELSISDNIPNDQSRMILKEFLPISNSLQLKRNPFEKNEDLRTILIQNLVFFDYDTNQRITDFKLNDMLMCNFKYLTLILPTWTTKDMNRFLKLWRKGACPRLCELAFYYDPEDWIWNYKEILKGISFKEFTGERQIQLFGDGEPTSIQGGYDIHGKDGRICSIEVTEPYHVVFYFWNF